MSCSAFGDACSLLFGFASTRDWFEELGRSRGPESGAAEWDAVTGSAAIVVGTADVVDASSESALLAPLRELLAMHVDGAGGARK